MEAVGVASPLWQRRNGRAYAISDNSIMTLVVNATSRLVSDTEYDVAVFGTEATLNSAASDFAGAGIEVGYEYELDTGGLLEVSLGQEFGDGAAGPSLDAGITWKF